MWSYEKRLQYPVKIKETNAKLASAIMAQLGGPNRFAILCRFFAGFPLKTLLFPFYYVLKCVILPLVLTPQNYYLLQV